MKVLVLLALVACAAARRPSQQIVGGAAASAGEWPWQGGLLSNGAFNCGCSVAHANWIITAGHCVGGAVGSYSVEVGSITRGSGTRINAATIVRHPDYADGYTPEGFTPYDIAIIGAVVPLDGVNIAPVAGGLDSGIDRLSHTCFITGWGRTCGNCAIPVALQEAQIPVIDDETCRGRYPAAYNPNFNICVLDPAGTAGACNGDSGGPLVCRADATGAWELVGAASYVTTGCITTEPSVYTRISFFLDWLCTESGGEIGTCAQ